MDSYLACCAVLIVIFGLFLWVADYVFSRPCAKPNDPAKPQLWSPNYRHRIGQALCFVFLYACMLFQCRASLTSPIQLAAVLLCLVFFICLLVLRDLLFSRLPPHRGIRYLAAIAWCFVAIPLALYIGYTGDGRPMPAYYEKAIGFAILMTVCTLPAEAFRGVPARRGA